MDSKQKKIVSMFDNIAKSYDLANRVLSFGSDIAWRKIACDKAYEFYDKKEIEKVLDVACGTGDMLKFWQQRAKKYNISIKELIGVDPSSGMLEIAKSKFPSFNYIKAYAQDLPIEDSSCDFVSISYGIRNVIDRIDAIREFNRALKPGGLLIILEFTKRENRKFIDNLVEFYLKRVLPTIGGLISGNKDAYNYLPNSIDNFLTTKKLIDELKSNGFEMLYCKPFSMGISTLFIAKKV